MTSILYTETSIKNEKPDFIIQGITNKEVYIYIYQLLSIYITSPFSELKKQILKHQGRVLGHALEF